MAIYDDHVDEPEREPRAPGPRWALWAGVAVIAVAVAAWWLWPEPSRPVVVETPAPAATAPVVAPKPAESPAPSAPAVPEVPARERTERKPKPVEAPVPAASAFALHVETDLPGASVFVDRRYVGTSPLTTSDVTPGTHQVNVSLEGQEGVAQSVDVAESGTTSVSLRFRDVKLDARVQVVHKHGMGSCDGRLLATPAGLRYETTHTGDAFTLPFADLEVFELDYLAKALKVKRRGGKTWNFTTKTESADPLFIFHRDVEKARKKLSGSL